MFLRCLVISIAAFAAIIVRAETSANTADFVQYSQASAQNAARTAAATAQVNGDVAGETTGPKAPASTYSSTTVNQLESMVKAEIYHQYMGARIELTQSLRLVSGAVPTKIQNVRWMNEPVRGEAILSVNDGAAQVRANFEAMVPARVAKMRILPNQKLSQDMFVFQDVNVASGMAYELKGVVLPPEENVERLETRQTIMQGQFLISSAVDKIPDIRKGDQIRIRMVSGELNLTTAGIAMEPGYTNSPIKVIVAKTKRELTGELQADGLVEVKLQ